MARERVNWKTKKNKFRLIEILKIVDELSDFYPLTLRQVFYQLVSKEILPNTDSFYRTLSKLCKWGRLDGFIPWEALEDRVRTHGDYTGFIKQARCGIMAAVGSGCLWTGTAAVAYVFIDGTKSDSDT